MSQQTARWFQGDRRTKCTVNDYNLLVTSGSERRCQFSLSIPLFEDGQLTGAPGWMLDDYNQLVKSSAQGKKIVYDKESTVSAMTVECFSTAKIRQKFFPPLVGCTIRPERMERTGKEDEKEIYLHFKLYAPATEIVHNWVFQHKTASFWASFEQVQGELDLEDDNTAPDDEEDDSDEDDE